MIAGCDALSHWIGGGWTMLKVSESNTSSLELSVITRYEIDHAALNMDPARTLGKISDFYRYIATDQMLVYLLLEHQEYLWPIIDKHIRQAITLENRIFRVTPEADAAMLSGSINGLIAPRPLSIIHDIYELSMNPEFCKYFSTSTYMACILDIEDELRHNADAHSERKTLLDFNKYTGMKIPAFIKAYRFDLLNTRQYIVSVRTSIRDSDYHKGIMAVIPEPSSMEEAIVQASLLAKMSRRLSPGYLDDFADSLEQLGDRLLPETLRAASKLVDTVMHLGPKRRGTWGEIRGDSIHIYSDEHGMILQASAVDDSRPVKAELYVRLDNASTYYLEIV